MTTHEEPSAPRLHAVTTLCGGTSCPTVYRSERQTVVVQGYAVSDTEAGLTVPDGERLVEIPIDLLLAAADEIRAGGPA